MKFLIFATVALSSFNASAAACLSEALDMAETIMLKNRETYARFHVDLDKSLSDQANTDKTLYRFTGQTNTGDVSTFTYELTMDNEDCSVESFRRIGGN